MMQTQIGAAVGPKISAPVFCENVDPAYTGAYIEIHGRGAMMRREAPGGAVNGFADVVTGRAKAMGIHVSGWGRGVCWTEAPDRWNFSVGITDWKHADAMLQIIDEEMTRFNVRGRFGLSLRGISCGTSA